MRPSLLSVPAVFLLAYVLAINCHAQAPGAKRSTPKRGSVRVEVQICRDRLKELDNTGDHFDALTPEKLLAVQNEINDCIYTESAGLSKVELLTAYKLRDSSGKEVIKRVKEAVQKTADEDQKLRDDDQKLREAGRTLAQGYVDQDKGYRDLIEKYNALVGSYNSLIRDYRSNELDNIRFLGRLQVELKKMSYNCELDNLQNILSSVPQRSSQVVYTPPAQIQCTTQNMPSPVPGLPSWSYTNCH